MLAVISLRSETLTQVPALPKAASLVSTLDHGLPEGRDKGARARAAPILLPECWAQRAVRCSIIS